MPFDVVEADNPSRNRDRQVKLIMFSTILDEITSEIDVEKLTNRLGNH